MDSAIIQFPIKANMRGGLGFNGTISGLHHPEYIWITSPGLCGNQPWCDGLEVKKCGCNVLLESTAFQECIQGVERSFQNRKERYGKIIVCIFSAKLRKEDSRSNWYRSEKNSQPHHLVTDEASQVEKEGRNRRTALQDSLTGTQSL